MKHWGVMLLVVSIATVSLLAGCGPKKADSPSQALQAAKALKTADEQINYLIGQANAFYSSKEYKQSIEIAQYVLRELDKNSSQAKAIIEKAKAQLESAAKSAAGDLQKNLGTFGK